MLYSQDFLKKLDSQKNRIIYIRITSLDFNENPITSLEGRATGGSINIDGASAIRRTCQLTLITDKYDYNDLAWSMHNKFKVEIGVSNYIDFKEPNIIWFPQGIFIITSFNVSHQVDNFSISVSGKDKMCLLNGEISGSLESSVDFGTISEENLGGVWVTRKIPIEEIIRNIVHYYGGEPLHNIIINDLDAYGLELLEYRYNSPMYLYKKKNSIIYDNVLLNGNKWCRVNGEAKQLKDLSGSELEVLTELTINTSTDAADIYFDNDDQAYTVSKIEYGETIGYRETELVYAGDLVANVGESLTSVLDKIKNMLVEFEYFYNTDGQFVFQKKKSFITPIKTPWDDDIVVNGLINTSSSFYNFSNGELISAFNNTPNIANMKNDYSIWGERTGVSGSTLAVHMRYAIDTKPLMYVQIPVSQEAVDDYNTKYNTSLTGREKDKCECFIASDETRLNQKENDVITHYVDWREVIYQMASDYYAYNWLDDFEVQLAAQNSLYPTGRTGYEQYYVDIQGFWRQLYNPWLSFENITLINNKNSLCEKIDELNITNLKEEIIKLENEINSNEDYQKLWNKRKELKIAENKLYLLQQQLNKVEQSLAQNEYDLENYYGDGNYFGWHKNTRDHPDQLNFWFDFLDTEGDLSQFNVQQAGDRLKSISDTKVKAVFFKETPNIMIVENITTTETPISNDKRYIQIPDIEAMTSISAQGKSAKERLDELLYQHGYCIESTTITAIPIYYLEPNTRIHIYDEKTKLNGDYIMSKISLPLTAGSTMSIVATKASEILPY